jgi:hypothetical protein
VALLIKNKQQKHVALFSVVYVQFLTDQIFTLGRFCLQLREAKGDLELDDLNQVPYLRITQPLLDCLDFTSFENKEGMGSLYDRHRERVN